MARCTALTVVHCCTLETCTSSSMLSSEAAGAAVAELAVERL